MPASPEEPPDQLQENQYEQSKEQQLEHQAYASTQEPPDAMGRVGDRWRNHTLPARRRLHPGPRRSRSEKSRGTDAGQDT